jgi:hypothetical protein
MTREEPSLETLWLQNIETMDKVKITDRRKTALMNFLANAIRRAAAVKICH